MDAKHRTAKTEAPQSTTILSLAYVLTKHFQGLCHGNGELCAVHPPSAIAQTTLKTEVAEHMTWVFKN